MPISASGLYCYMCTDAPDNSYCIGKDHIVNCSDYSSATANYDACRVDVSYDGMFSKILNALAMDTC